MYTNYKINPTSDQQSFHPKTGKMWPLKKLILSTLLLLHLTTFSIVAAVSKEARHEHEGDVISASTEIVNTTLFYQSHVPLIFKFRVPTWKVDNLRLNKSLHCQTDDVTLSDNYLCSVAYHLEHLLTPLVDTMRFYKNVVSASGGEFYERNFHCDRIKPHFLHFSTQLGGLTPYIAEYKNRCTFGKNATLIIRSNVSGAAQHAVMAYGRFKTLHEESKERKGSEWKFLQMTGYMALQNSYAFTQYVESLRWANAFTSCQSFRLDVGLLSPAMLNDSLTELSSNLFASGYNFSLPFLSSLPHYYKIPLVDCILTVGSGGSKIDSVKSEGDSTANLIIRLLVPIVKLGVTHKLIKLNKVPYLLQDKAGDKICEIQNFQTDDAFLVEVNDTTGNKTVIAKTSSYCGLSKLCKVPEITHRHAVDPCVVGVITKNHSMTAQFCFFECYVLPSALARDKVFPMFTQISSNEIAITGEVPVGKPQITIECQGQTTHTITANSSEGIILVVLPCTCELVYGVKRFMAQDPCNESLSVEQVTEFGSHHHHSGSIYSRDDFIDYLVESMDSHQFNITFSKSSKQESAGANTERNTAGETSQTQSHIQMLHCGHILLWMFLITLLFLNLLTIFILYKNGIINLGSLFSGGTSNISRLNEIPVSNMGSSPI